MKITSDAWQQNANHFQYKTGRQTEKENSPETDTDAASEAKKELEKNIAFLEEMKGA